MVLLFGECSVPQGLVFGLGDGDEEVRVCRAEAASGGSGDGGDQSGMRG